MTTERLADGPSFLSEGGLMGALMRAHDWTLTPLGEPATWPQSLQTALSICLNAKVVSALYWGRDLRILYNDAYAPVLAERHPGALGLPLREVWSEVWDVVGPQLASVMTTGAGFATESQRLMILRQGRLEETFWIYSFAPVRVEAGDIGGVFLTAMDITGQVNSGRRNLVERDRAWRLSQDALAVCEADGTLAAVNAAWTTILGWEEQDLVGFRFVEFTHPDDLEATLAVFASVFEAPLVTPYAYRFRHKDGTYRWLAWTAAFEEGRVYASGRDITSEKVQAEALANAEEALRQAQKMEAVGQLTGGVAHDFNNFLTVMKSSTDLLKRPDLPEERRQRYIGAISDTVDRAAKLTAQLLAFARRQALQPTVFDVGAGIGSLAEMLGTLTGSRIEIVTNLPDPACFVSADPSQFDTAIVNMAVNARDAMQGEGRLTFTVHTVSTIPAVRSHPPISGDFVAVCIEDTGSGITPEQIERIFEPFYTTKGIGEGTGLGLSQVFGFAKQSGGEVRVQSEVGQGTKFVLYLPRVEATADTVAIEPEPLVDGHGTRVLLIEDNVEVGSFATQTLAELGYSTLLVSNAVAALSELASDADRFDVVFTDVVMPGMNGIELAQEIRSRHGDLPVVLTSGYSHVLAQDGTGGFELLHKPYSVEQLSRILRNAARQRNRNS